MRTTRPIEEPAIDATPAPVIRRTASRRPPSADAVVAAVVVLVCVVALGASARVGGADVTGGSGGIGVLRAMFTVAAALVGTLLLAGAATLVWLLAGPRHRRHHDDLPEQAPITIPATRLARFVAMMVALLLLASVGALIWLAIHAHASRSPVIAVPPPLSGATAPTQSPLGNASVGHGPDIALILGGIVVLVVVAAIAALLITLRDRRARIPADDCQEGFPTETAMATLPPDPASIPDPRQAVLAAYRHVEISLGARGLTRTTTETPHEFLGRSTATQRELSGPMTAITALFERARFSSHRISSTMRLEAIEQARNVAATAVDRAGRSAATRGDRLP